MRFSPKRTEVESLVHISDSCWKTIYAPIYREEWRKFCLACVLAIRELAITNCMGGSWAGPGDLKTFIY